MNAGYRMSYLFKSLGLFLLCLVVFCKVYAQTGAINDDTFQGKLNLYSKANPASLLFVHTDKTIYTNNETIWFSAYLLLNQEGPLMAHTIVSVALVREDNRKVSLQDEYAMKDGLSAGSLSLPNSIAPGNNQLIASTNVLDKNGKPLAMFTQPVTIKSITVQSFGATISILDTVVKQGSVRAKLSIVIQEPKPKEKTTITYSVSSGAEQSAILKEEQNEYIITIPQEQLNQVQPLLLTSVKYNKQVQHLSLKLPQVKPQGINVRFFPEGGNLANGLEGTVGWEARTTGDMPVALSGILYRDNEPVGTIATNNYGVGTFKLKPDSKSQYSLRIAANKLLPKDTVYMLPKAIENGIVLHLANAIVNDTLQINLYSKETRNVQVLIHNYREPYASFSAQAKSTGSQVSIVLGPLIPKGIAIVTVLDEEGKPLAERLFFAHYDRGITTGIQPDKPVYEKKEKVNVKLKLTDQAGQPVRGLVSIACVQDNRIEKSRQQDIESYVYLSQELGALPPDPLGRGFDNKEYLENMLLIRGWRRYTWQSLMSCTPADTVRHAQTPIIRGKVSHWEKTLKKPVSVSVLKDSSFNRVLIPTQSDGTFALSRDNLLTTEGRKIKLSVNQDNQEGYTIEVENPFIPVNQQLAGQIEIQNTGIAQRMQSSIDQQLEGMERGVVLQGVTVTAKKDNDLYGRVNDEGGPNACGDYVCRYNILNCNNHFNQFDNRRPIKGRVYSTNLETLVTYAGCDDVKSSVSIFRVNGIYSAREFYGVNVTPAGLLEPQFFSTLFWKAALVVNDKGEAECSFYTGDITGKFRIVLQGISDKDMIFGVGNFTVK